MEAPIVLCIDTATDICSVAIFKGEELLHHRETERSFSHSEVITVFIDECFRTSGIHREDIDAIAIAGGPGSYTALRIGASTAKGLCFALDVPLIAVSTLDVLVEAMRGKIQPGELVIPLLDARRKEVYHAIYDDKLNRKQELSPFILSETAYTALSEFKRLHFIGDGVEKAKEILTIANAVFHPDILNSARWMIKPVLDKFYAQAYEDLIHYEPYYYKSVNINTPKKKWSWLSS